MGNGKLTKIHVLNQAPPPFTHHRVQQLFKHTVAHCDGGIVKVFTNRNWPFKEGMYCHRATLISNMATGDGVGVRGLEKYIHFSVCNTNHTFCTLQPRVTILSAVMHAHSMA